MADADGYSDGGVVHAPPDAEQAKQDIPVFFGVSGGGESPRWVKPQLL